MKNIEKYEKEISQLINEGDNIECAIATVAGIRKSKPCSGEQCCEVCEKKCIEWMYSEYKEEILSDDEKEIVKSMINVIHKFGLTVINVEKINVGNCECFISISYENHDIRINETISSPLIYNYKFKGMELKREYTLEELGITCQTQKDN